MYAYIYLYRYMFKFFAISLVLIRCENPYKLCTLKLQNVAKHNKMCKIIIFFNGKMYLLYFKVITVLPNHYRTLITHRVFVYYNKIR